MAVIVSVRMIMASVVVRGISLLSQLVIFREGLVQPVLVAAGVGARFRVKGRLQRLQAQAQRLQQAAQYRVGLDLQEVGIELYRGVAIAQVVGSLNQLRRGATGSQHGLRGGKDFHKTAVVGHQHVAVAQNRAARHEDCNLFTRVQGGCQAAAATFVIGQDQLGTACQQGTCNALSGADFLVNSSHEDSVKNRRVVHVSPFGAAIARSARHGDDQYGVLHCAGSCRNNPGPDRASKIPCHRQARPAPPTGQKRK